MSDKQPQLSGLNVVAKDMDARYAELTASGCRGLQEPLDAFWGARYAIIEDPDGNAIGIMSPADDSLRSAPPDI